MHALLIEHGRPVAALSDVSEGAAFEKASRVISVAAQQMRAERDAAGAPHLDEFAQWGDLLPQGEPL